MSHSSKSPGLGDNDFEGLEGDVLVALGLIVGVDGLERTVKDDGKFVHRGRLLGKFDDPLVTALGIAVHEDGGNGVVLHLCASCHTCLKESFFCIVNNEFLAKGVDEVLGASCDAELIRVFL